MADVVRDVLYEVERIAQERGDEQVEIPKMVVTLLDALEEGGIDGFRRVAACALIVLVQKQFEDRPTLTGHG